MITKISEFSFHIFVMKLFCLKNIGKRDSYNLLIHKKLYVLVYHPFLLLTHLSAGFGTTSLLLIDMICSKLNTLWTCNAWMLNIKCSALVLTTLDVYHLSPIPQALCFHYYLLLSVGSWTRLLARPEILVHIWYLYLWLSLKSYPTSNTLSLLLIIFCGMPSRFVSYAMLMRPPKRRNSCPWLQILCLTIIDGRFKGYCLYAYFRGFGYASSTVEY